MATSTSTNGLNGEALDEPLLDNGELRTNSLSRKEMKARKKAGARSRSAPGSREPSATRSMTTSTLGDCPTPPLGLMRENEKLHNSLVFLLSTTGTKAQQPSWRDKLRSRFSRRKEHEARKGGNATTIATQPLEL